MMLRVFGYGCLAIISTAILTVAGVLAWFAADRNVPTTVLSSEVLTPRVRPGDKLLIRQRIRYDRDCAAHVDRALYDSHTNRRFLDDVDYNSPPLGLGTRTVTFEESVPENFKGGSAEYRAVPSYSCNPLQRFYWPITRPETVLKFEVVENDAGSAP